MTEKEKMLAGIPFDGFNPDLVGMISRGRAFNRQFNALGPDDRESQRKLLETYWAKVGECVNVNAPIHIDYGQVEIGDSSFINYNCVILDEAFVRIGKNCFIGPNCAFYTIQHALGYQPRNEGRMQALAITVGDNVWIGGNVVLLPGVEIGAGSVIGTGSVVTRSIPSGVVAYGNPCRVIRAVTPEEEGFSAG